MQIQLFANSLGLKPKGLPVGLIINSSFWLRLRSSPIHPTHNFLIQREMVLNHDAESLLYNSFHTGWRQIDSKKHPWICNPDSLENQLIEVRVIGTYFGAGQADFELILINGSGEHSTLLSHMAVKASGIGIGGLKLRGRLRKKSQIEGVLCSID